jgi:GNAT superfamily N-acetyltransferase
VWGNMTLYAAFIKERENFDSVEEEYGFATYQIRGNLVYLRDVYVIPKERQKGYASLLSDRVAEISKKQGCPKNFTTVACLDPNEGLNIQIVTLYGFKFTQTNGQLSYFEKEL